jgi:hypothetical protein
VRSVLVALVLFGSDLARADDYRASVELTDTKPPHAVVTAKLTCATPAKCPAWTLDLGTADETGVIALVDLAGAPTHVRGTDTPAATLPGATRMPAAVVRTKVTDAANNRWERWAIVSLDSGRAKLVWRGELAMRSANGGGFTTDGGIELVATEPGKPLALAFAQLSIPKPGDKSKPRPLMRRFVFKNGAYQRE